MRQILQPAQISCGLWYCMGVEGGRENPENKKERGTKNDRNHRHFHLGIRRRHRHPDRHPLTEKQRGEKTMEFIVTAIIIAAASVVVTLIATR